MPSQKPGQAPKADMSLLIKQLNETRAKVGLPPVTSQLPLWKRWLESVAEYDGKGLRDVVNANALYLDAVKDDLDNLKENQSVINSNQNQRLAAIEAQLSSTPFPG